MRIHDAIDILEASRSTLSGSSFDDVNLSGASLTGCRLTGASIDGILIEDLLAAYKATQNS